MAKLKQNVIVSIFWVFLNKHILCGMITSARPFLIYGLQRQNRKSVRTSNI
jgi:hypothetical protein